MASLAVVMYITIYYSTEIPAATGRPHRSSTFISGSGFTIALSPVNSEADLFSGPRAVVDPDVPLGRHHTHVRDSFHHYLLSRTRLMHIG
jgi:hypothetical protein